MSTNLNVYVRVTRENAVLAGYTTYGVKVLEVTEEVLAQVPVECRRYLARWAGETTAFQMKSPVATLEALLEETADLVRREAQAEVEAANAELERQLRRRKDSLAALEKARAGEYPGYITREALTKEERAEFDSLDAAWKLAREQRSQADADAREAKRAAAAKQRADTFIAAVKMTGGAPLLVEQYDAKLLPKRVLHDVLERAYMPMPEGLTEHLGAGNTTDAVQPLAPTLYAVAQEVLKAAQKAWPLATLKLITFEPEFDEDEDDDDTREPCRLLVHAELSVGGWDLERYLDVPNNALPKE